MGSSYSMITPSQLAPRKGQDSPRPALALVGLPGSGDKPVQSDGQSGGALTAADLVKLRDLFVCDDLASHANLRRISHPQVDALIGDADGAGPGIVIPYMLPGKNSPRGARLWCDSGELVWGSGSSRMLYFAPRTEQEALRNVDLKICIASSELSALALSRLLAGREESSSSFVAVGIAGLNGWQDPTSRAGGFGPQPIADLDLIVWNSRPVIICPDPRDLNGPNGKAVEELEVELARRGAVVSALVYQHSSGIPTLGAWLVKKGCDAVFESITHARPSQVRVYSNFIVTDEGVFSVEKPGKNGRELVCSRLSVEAVTRNSENEEWGRLLAWVDQDGKPHSWAMPMSLLSGECSDVRATLLSGGVRITPGKLGREALIRYIQTVEPIDRILCVSQVGWCGDAFVLPDETIGNACGNRVVFQEAHGHTDHHYNLSGTLDEWQGKVSRWCVGNSRLVFAVSCAFASPLLDIANVDAGGFHFRGSSSCGKTTALLAAGSVWGGGGLEGFVQSWRATANGLEATAALHNNTLLCLDELGQLDPREAGEVAYLLANGRGKTRMSKNITARRLLAWNLIFLSTGEVGLPDVVSAAGGKVRGGHQVRFIDIPADAGKEMGCFERIHDSSSPGEFARKLALAAKTCYGTAARTFLSRLVASREKAAKDLHSDMREFCKRVEEYASGEVQRASLRFALVAAAGELATRYGITNWEPGEAVSGVLECFQSWISARGGAQPTDEETALRAVRAFLEAHGQSRFQPTDPGSPECRISNRVGYRQTNEDGKTDFFVMPEAFKSEVCRGLDWRFAVDVLSKRGYLRGESNRHTTRRSFEGVSRGRFYVIPGDILGEGE